MKIIKWNNLLYQFHNEFDFILFDINLKLIIRIFELLLLQDIFITIYKLSILQYSKSRYSFYDNFQLSLYFCAFSRPSISGNSNGFFISSYSKKQDCLNSIGQKNLIFFFFQNLDLYPNTNIYLVEYGIPCDCGFCRTLNERVLRLMHRENYIWGNAFELF